MKCANCRREGAPAYTLRAHIDNDRAGDERTDGRDRRTDGGVDAAGETIDLRFCSFECLETWT